MGKAISVRVSETEWIQVLALGGQELTKATVRFQSLGVSEPLYRIYEFAPWLQADIYIAKLTRQDRDYWVVCQQGQLSSYHFVKHKPLRVLTLELYQGLPRD